MGSSLRFDDLNSVSELYSEAKSLPRDCSRIAVGLAIDDPQGVTTPVIYGTTPLLGPDPST
jgi:hypothetical protein